MRRPRGSRDDLDRTGQRRGPLVIVSIAPRRCEYWRVARARLDRKELDREVGWLTVPELPLPSDAHAAPLTSAP
jgi:hypothetical protein